MTVLPRAGDVSWTELDPVLGTEQTGRRPAIVLSDMGYRERSTRAVVCPITTVIRDWPFDVHLTASMRTQGVALVDQVRTVHRASRLFDDIELAPEQLLAQVRGRLATLLGIVLLNEKGP